MHGDVVTAAKWLGGCLVLSSLVLVAGFHPTVTGRVLTVSRVQPVGEFAPPPAPLATTAAYSPSPDGRMAAPLQFFDAPGR